MSFSLHTNTSTWGFPCSFFISNALSFTALQRSASLSDLDQDYVQGAHPYHTQLPHWAKHTAHKVQYPSKAFHTLPNARSL